MKNKSKLFILIAVCLLIAVCFVGCNKDYKMTVYQNEINVGVNEPFVILHTSDTHLTLAGDRDSQTAHNKSKQRQGMGPGEQRLDIVQKTAQENNATIVHTGDAMDFLTYANIDYFKSFLQRTNALYIPGNHEMESLKEEFEDPFSQMTERSTDFFSQEINGVLFVGINNYNHKMTYEQLDKLKEVVALEKPIVLLVHVPLYSRDLYDVCVSHDGFENAAWLMAVPEELMTNYPSYLYESQKADEATKDAYNYIVAQNSIKAILSGHLHIDFETKVGNIPQYVTSTDSLRLITIK